MSLFDNSPSQQVAQYYMSIHFGVTSGPIDEFNIVKINDKVCYSGVIPTNQAITFDKPDLFGGIKQNGGVGGVVDVYLGGEDQTASTELANRLGGIVTYTTSSASTAGVAGEYQIISSDVTNASPGHQIFVASIDGTGTGALSTGTTIVEIDGDVIKLDKPVLTTFAVDGTTGNYPQLTWSVSIDGVGNTPTTVPGFRGLSSLFFYSGTSTTRPLPGTTTIDPDSGPNGTTPGSPTSETVAHKGFYWTANYPSVPVVSATVTRFPNGPNGVKIRNSNGSANPADIVWECLTNEDWGLGAPIGMLDVPSFTAAAATLTTENFGLSMLWTRSDVVENFISEVLSHIQAVLTIDPRTGRLVFKLLRNDYDPATLPVIHPGNATITNWQRKTWGEVANEVVVTYTDPVNYLPVSVTVQDNGLVAVQGSVISSTRNYYGITDGTLAVKVAHRDLKQAATPLLGLDIEVNREAWSWTPGTVLELRWPEYGIVSMWVRIVTINYGRPGASIITINVLEDIFGFGSAIYTDLPADDPTAPPAGLTPPDVPSYTPPPVVPLYDPIGTETGRGTTAEQPRTLDYLYLGDALYYALATAVGDDRLASITYPQAVDMVLTGQNSLATSVIGMWVERADSTGAIRYVNTENRPNVCHGYLSAALVSEETSTVAVLSGKTGSPVISGYLALLHDPSDITKQEVCIVETVDTDQSFVVWRGVLDTSPKAWPIGTVVWLFKGDLSSFDSTIRPVGAVANYRFTPKTSEGMLPLGSTTVKSMTVNERIYSPYRPANISIDGQVWAVPTPAQGDVVVTFNRRNRTLETARILKWTDPDVAPESNQTVVITIHRSNGTQVARHDGITGTSFTIPEADLLLAGGPTALVRISSERYDVSLSATFESYQYVERVLDLSSWVFIGYGRSYGVTYGG